MIIVLNLVMASLTLVMAPSNLVPASSNLVRASLGTLNFDNLYEFTLELFCVESQPSWY